MSDLFTDPEVIDPTGKYRKALEAKIGPLEETYLALLEKHRAEHEAQGGGAPLEQVSDEIRRLKEIPWRGGFVKLAEIPAPGELPGAVETKAEIFSKEFQARLFPIMRTYRESLEAMLRRREFRGKDETGDLKKALQLLDGYEGAVRATYVKLESLPDQGIKHATLARIEILDQKGGAIPFQEYSKVKVSSYEKNDFDFRLGGGKERPGENAIDGDPRTFWHSKWNNGGADFPHWISFHLGKESWISGFRIEPREMQRDRETDITNWRFYVSDNGRNWTLVAEGRFPKGNEIKEFTGLTVKE